MRFSTDTNYSAFQLAQIHKILHRLSGSVDTSLQACVKGRIEHVERDDALFDRVTAKDGLVFITQNMRKDSPMTKLIREMEEDHVEMAVTWVIDPEHKPAYVGKIESTYRKDRPRTQTRTVVIERLGMKRPVQMRVVEGVK